MCYRDLYGWEFDDGDIILILKYYNNLIKILDFVE